MLCWFSVPPAESFSTVDLIYSRDFGQTSLLVELDRQHGLLFREREPAGVSAFQESS